MLLSRAGLRALAALCLCRAAAAARSDEARICHRFPGACAVRPLRRSRQQAPRARPRLAVLVVGLRERLYPETTLRHVVAPAAAAGYEVDYLLLLGRAASARKRWRSRWLQPAANPALRNLTAAALQDHVAARAEHYNASRAIFLLLRKDVDVHEVPWDPSWRRWFGRSSRDHPGLLLSLRRFKKIELLWNHTARAGGGYRHVVLVRDDAHWLADLRLERFPDPHAVYARPRGNLCAPPSRPLMANDGVFVIGGRVAGVFLRVYREYLHNPSTELDTVKVEGFFNVLARLREIQLHMVRHSWLPFLIAVHVQRPDSARPRLCLRSLKRKDLSRARHSPMDDCVHPRHVQQPLCEEFPLT